uniref:Phospholipase/carboxylesterase/thioesterase domain-containing protein n=1 Tax=Ananas comosus var. bracteatus TaxID=296719 RepID=A0A6V7NZI3_ANACO|nr:unnamed protein product [Ananas comosus var. bracteatus]
MNYGAALTLLPKGRHQATIVWLHGLGDNGASWSQLLDSLPLPNIKWICPTASTRPVAAFGGFPCTAWFDVEDTSLDGRDDVEGLDASAAHVANLLSAEPPEAWEQLQPSTLLLATLTEKFANGNHYPISLSAVVGLSGWLPCSRSLKSKIENSQGAFRRAATLPLLLSHERAGDEVVRYKNGERSTEILRSSGFSNLTFKTYSGLGHYTVPEEMEDVRKWLTANLGLDR